MNKTKSFNIKPKYLKIILPVVFLLPAIKAPVSAQKKFKPHGKIEGKIFTDFNSSLNRVDNTKNFELKRAYLGYELEFAPHFSSKIRVDVGGAEFITPKVNSQYVFFKTAAVYYKTKKIMVGAGLQDTYQFKVEEKLWEKRYIMPTMPDYQKFNFSADIGVAFVYKIKRFDFDFSFFNGQGYKQFDADNAFRSSLGVTSYFLDKKILLRAYGDYSTDSLHMSSFTGLAGLNLKRLSFGAEYTFQKNYIYTSGHNRSGYSLFGQFNITSKFDIWFRIDDLWSDFNMILPEDPDLENKITYIDRWLERDGLYAFVGIEYIIVPKHLRVSANYRHHKPDGTGNMNYDYIFVNLEVKWSH